ncbi:MAG: TRAP transporter small permease [Rubrivivax sp.]
MNAPDSQPDSPDASAPIATAATADPVDPADLPPRVPLALEDVLTAAVMAALALITFANVLVRYFSSQSFAWTEEVSVFLMIVLALVASSAAVARHAHIRIEYFADGGTPERRRALARFGALMVCVLFTLMAVLSVRMVWDDIRFEETSPGIGVPKWWYSIWLPVLATAIALRALGLFLRKGARASRGTGTGTGDATGQGPQP